MSWKEIWRRKAQPGAIAAGLLELIALDGFDTGLGRIEPRAWTVMVMGAAARLHLKLHERVCEIGCGAGAFLVPLYQAGFSHLWGLDYSPAHVTHCRRAIPGGNFVAAEAAHVPFSAGFFDVEICNSVFQYFTTLEYADRVVQEIARTTRDNGRTLILDVNDADKRDEFEARRHAVLSPGEYDRLYQNASHLFYEREWWYSNADRWGMSVEISDQAVEGYGNAEYRYNVLLCKRS